MFWKEYFRKNIKIAMKITDKIRDENLQHDINNEAAKISALSSGKIDKYKYLTGEEILLFDQTHIIEKAKFTYSPLRKALEKQTKTIQNQGKKEVKAIENRVEKKLLDTDQKSIAFLFSKEFLIEEAIYEFNKFAETEKKITRSDFICKTGNKKKVKKYDFQKFKNTRSFGREIYSHSLSLEDILKQQIRLKDNFVIFEESTKPQIQ